MSEWLVVAPRSATDVRLERTTWIAQQTIARARTKPSVLDGSDATRARFDAVTSSAPAPRGVAFFGHGDEGNLYGASANEDADEVILDVSNASTTTGKWVHALACRAGIALADAAVAAGAELFAGYTTSLEVTWDVPPAFPVEFGAVVTATTLALVDGVRDPSELRRRVDAAVKALERAIEAEPNDAPPMSLYFLTGLAVQLVEHLVVHVRTTPA